jgi:hypothetical protein
LVLKEGKKEFGYVEECGYVEGRKVGMLVPVAFKQSYQRNERHERLVLREGKKEYGYFKGRKGNNVGTEGRKE